MSAGLPQIARHCSPQRHQSGLACVPLVTPHSSSIHSLQFCSCSTALGSHATIPLLKNHPVFRKTNSKVRGTKPPSRPPGCSQPSCLISVLGSHWPLPSTAPAMPSITFVQRRLTSHTGPHLLYWVCIYTSPGFVPSSPSLCWEQPFPSHLPGKQVLIPKPPTQMSALFHSLLCHSLHPPTHPEAELFWATLLFYAFHCRSNSYIAYLYSLIHYKK